jgi:hypothetical protein
MRRKSRDINNKLKLLGFDIDGNEGIKSFSEAQLEEFMKYKYK